MDSKVVCIQSALWRGISAAHHSHCTWRLVDGWAEQAQVLSLTQYVQQARRVGCEHETAWIVAIGQGEKSLVSDLARAEISRRLEPLPSGL